MPAIDYIHTTVDSSTTSTSTSFAEVAETTALVDGKTYYIICHALCGGSDANKVFEWQLVDRTNSDAVLTDSTLIREVGHASYTQPYCFIGKITAGSDGGGIEFQQKAPSGETVRTEYLSLLLLDLDNLRKDDFFFATDSTTTAHTTSYADRVSKTLAGSKSNDTWLVFGWVATATDNLAKTADAQMVFTEGGSDTAGPIISYEGEDFTETLGWWFCRPYTITTSGSVSWKIQTKDSDSHANQNDHLGSTLFGLKMGAFQQSSTFYDGTGSASTSTDWREMATSAFTPESTGPVIAVASATYDGDSAGRLGYSRIQVGNSTSPNAVPDSEQNAFSNDAIDELSMANVTVFTGTQNTTSTVDLDVKKGESASTAMEDISLSVFTTELDYEIPATIFRTVRGGMHFRNRQSRKNLSRLRR